MQYFGPCSLRPASREKNPAWSRPRLTSTLGHPPGFRGLPDPHLQGPYQLGHERGRPMFAGPRTNRKLLERRAPSRPFHNRGAAAHNSGTAPHNPGAPAHNCGAAAPVADAASGPLRWAVLPGNRGLRNDNLSPHPLSQRCLEASNVSYKFELPPAEHGDSSDPLGHDAPTSVRSRGHGADRLASRPQRPGPRVPLQIAAGQASELCSTEVMV